MKLNFSKSNFLIVTILLLTSQNIFSQCDLPQPFTGNTGSNMTVFFTSGAIDALPLNSDAPYIVAFSPDGLTVGSASVASADLIGGQQSLAVWADDTATPETDGAMAGQPISFQLVDGNSLYDLNLSFAGPNSFTANGQLPVIAASAEINCSESDSGSGSSLSCDLPQEFSGNTGSNMTIFLTPDVISAFPLSSDSPYVVALSPDGLVVGSASVASADLIGGQQSIGVWGDDTGTPEIDGLLAGEEISFQLVDGNSLYDLNLSFGGPNSYVTNGILPAIAGTAELNCSGSETISVNPGCTDENAFNYDDTATEDDGSCIEIVYGCTDNGLLPNGVPNVNGSFSSINDADGDQLPAFNYNPFANTDDGSCISVILGCMDSTAFNYDPNANTNDSSCIPVIFGCTDIAAFNYNPLVNTNDGSCYPVIYGCLDSNAFNFNDYDYDNVGNLLTGINGVDVNTDNGLCIPVIFGCLDQTALNYSIPSGDVFTDANTDDGSCIALVLGCMEVWADNYNPLANLDDGSCDRLGCTSEWADNYDELATTDDGSCDRLGCMSDWADNFDDLATIDDGSCDRLGCIFEWADNYDDLATTDDGSCDRLGCIFEWADNYDVLATTDDGSCDRLGCMSGWADNYDDLATTDDGSCDRLGCMEIWADNYDDLATTDDGSCDRLGCILESADNYDDLATTDDGSCLFTGCMNPDADNYNPQANVSAYCQFLGCTSLASLNYDPTANEDDGSCIAVVQSCTNPAAYNYNPNANEDNGSCLFDQNHVDSLSNYYQYFLNQYNTVVLAASILQAELDFADPNSFGKIELNLIPGWNTVGYNVIQPTDIVAQFEPIEDDLRLVKNNYGDIYWPQFGFNGIGDLIPGQGYQLRMDQSRTFSFTYTDQRRAISPMVPDWAIDMETEVHPNDIRTLVKVINLLGHEVNFDQISSGTTLLYLYNDGSVEKKLYY